MLALMISIFGVQFYEPVYANLEFGYDAIIAEQRITLDTFDYQRYAKDYPDVAAILGTDKESLYTHYKNHGKKEGKIAYVRPYKANKLDTFRLREDDSYYFDAESYAYINHSYLINVNKDKQSLWNHYKNYGMENGLKLHLPDKVKARQKVFEVASRITDESMSERDKVRAVHDWMASNTKYSNAKLRINGIEGYSKREHEMIGVMLDGSAVCSGYAEAFDYFMFVLGIEHERVSGYVSDDPNCLHAWNRVLIDGKWLYVDCTWDSPKESSGENFIHHDYLLRTYEQMASDHTELRTYKLY